MDGKGQIFNMHLGFVKNSKDVVLITEEAPKEVP